MTQVEKRIENKLHDSILMEFLGAENVEQLKVRIVDAIVERVIADLDNSYEYIISPEDMVDDIIDDITRSVKDKIRPKLEKKLYQDAMAKLGLSEDYPDLQVAHALEILNDVFKIFSILKLKFPFHLV